MNSSKENKNNELVLKAIQNEIEKHNKEKETIQNEMKEMRDPKIIEEASKDIEKIEETIKKYNEDRENFLEFIKEKEENERIINECKDKIAEIEKSQGRQSLLKDKKECQLAIENEKGKITSNSDGKMSITKEMQEYQLDLEKINAELKKFDTEMEKYNDKINNSKNRNMEISNSIGAIMDKYHIKLNTEPNAREDSIVNPKPEITSGRDIYSHANPKPEITSGRDIYSHSNPMPTKYKLTRLAISPCTNNIYYDHKENGKRCILPNECNLDYSDEAIQNAINKLKNKNIDSISEAIDPNIVRFLEDNSDKYGDLLDNYLDMLSNAKQSEPQIVYNLKDIYQSDLDYKQIKKINKIAKAAKKLSKGIITVEKDNIIRRAIGNMKKKLRYNIKKIAAHSEKKQEEKKGIKLNGKKFFIRAKQRAKDRGDKVSNLAHFTSKKVQRSIKNNWTHLKIIGTEIRGYVTGENPIITENRVRPLRDRLVVPEGTVDEKKALEQVAKGRKAIGQKEK